MRGRESNPLPLATTKASSRRSTSELHPHQDLERCFVVVRRLTKTFYFRLVRFRFR